jgi:hypothetical protein
MKKTEEKEKIKQHISAIQENYPPENYTLLREALDYCLDLLKEKELMQQLEEMRGE